MQPRFVADAMLGKLAKWLRVMGYDTHYQGFYPENTLDQLMDEGRTLLTRRRGVSTKYPDVVLLRSDRVRGQLLELSEAGRLTRDRSYWFTRCLRCNLSLAEVKIEQAREELPEYVFYNNLSELRACLSCGRYFWPGSHRTRMVRQLEEWGL